MKQRCGYAEREGWDLSDAARFMGRMRESHLKAMSVFHTAGHTMMGLATSVRYADGKVHEALDAPAAPWRPALDWCGEYRRATVLAAGPVAEYIAGFLLGVSTRDLVVPGGDAVPGFLTCDPNRHCGDIFTTALETECNSEGKDLRDALSNLPDTDDGMEEESDVGGECAYDLSRLTRRVVSLLRPGAPLSAALQHVARAIRTGVEVDEDEVKELIRQCQIRRPKKPAERAPWDPTR